MAKVLKNQLKNTKIIYVNVSNLKYLKINSFLFIVPLGKKQKEVPCLSLMNLKMASLEKLSAKYILTFCLLALDVCQVNWRWQMYTSIH